MSIRKSFNIQELVKVATEDNTNHKDTIDDLIFELSRCKQEMNGKKLPSLSDMIKQDENVVDFNSSDSISKIMDKPVKAKKHTVKNVMTGAGVVGAGIGYFNDILSFTEYFK